MVEADRVSGNAAAIVVDCADLATVGVFFFCFAAPVASPLTPIVAVVVVVVVVVVAAAAAACVVVAGLFFRGATVAV